MEHSDKHKMTSRGHEQLDTEPRPSESSSTEASKNDPRDIQNAGKRDSPKRRKRGDSCATKSSAEAPKDDPRRALGAPWRPEDGWL